MIPMGSLGKTLKYYWREHLTRSEEKVFLFLLRVRLRLTLPIIKRETIFQIMYFRWVESPVLKSIAVCKYKALMKVEWLVSINKLSE